MTTPLFVIGFMAFWIVLNRWVLPSFGIETCMSGACTRVTHPTRTDACSATDQSATHPTAVDTKKTAASHQ